MAVIDFASPHDKFAKFRVVAFPSGAITQPIKFPRSLLRANQSSLPASFEPSLASRIAKLVSQDGFLQLRPFLKTGSVAKDMIDGLPQPYKSMTTNGNELNFTKLREVIGNAIAEKEGQQSTMDNSTSLYSSSRRYTSPQMQEQVLTGQISRAQIRDQMQRDLANLQQTKASLAASLAVDRNCLAMVPASLRDSRLDHIALFFVAGSQTKPGEKFELIRFEDPAGALKETK